MYMWSLWEWLHIGFSLDSCCWFSVEKLRHVYLWQVMIFSFPIFVSGWIYEMLLLTNCFSCFPKKSQIILSMFVCQIVILSSLECFLLQKEQLNNEDISSHRDLAPDFKEKYFKQVLDHFNYNSLGNGTYDQRYLITGDNLPHCHTGRTFIICLNDIHTEWVHCVYCRSVLEERQRTHFLLHWQWRGHTGVCTEFRVHHRAGSSAGSTGDICWACKIFMGLLNHMTIEEVWQFTRSLMSGLCSL